MIIIPRVQIAGATSLKEAKDIIETMQSNWSHDNKHELALGLVYGPHEQLNEPPLTKDEIRQLSDESIQIILITYCSSADEILQVIAETGIQNIQLHGPIEPREIIKARKSIPDNETLLLLKSIPISIDESYETCFRSCLTKVKSYEDHIDGFILDTKAVIGGETRLGATGLTHNWNISKSLISNCQKPFLLAGGLHDKNVAVAIEKTGAWGADAHSGVEDHSQQNPALRLKDLQKVASFVKAIRKSIVKQ